MGESHAVLSWCVSISLEAFLVNWVKTFEQIEHYLDVARLHPTGRHWVDNFLLPTLLVHQFEREKVTSIRSS